MELKKSIVIFICMMIPAVTFTQERTIKSGDAIEIIVSNNQDLTRTVSVNTDGTIDYPTFQGLPVDGITLQRFQEILIAQLSRYMESTPLVLVRFSDSHPIKITILGQVANPGMYQIVNTITLQGAISAAGGFIPGAQLSRIKLIRIEDKETAEQIINMESFYLNADLSALPLLKEGDTIVVPGNPLATNVKVMGCVENPGNYEVFFQTTLLDVIFLAGGPTKDANLNDVKIVSLVGQNARKVRINIKEIMELKAFKNQPLVMPGDVVYISRKKLNWGKMVGFIRDITTFAMLYYVIVRSRDL